jgi:phosphohistidine phosphatase SixA
MLLTLAEDAFSFSQRVLMVGHNPACETLLINSLAPGQVAGNGKMATGTLAVIQFPGGFKQQVANGQLLHLRGRMDF